jgi:hypothetical protein
VREETTIQDFEQLFRERGLPAAIRSDNGVPFAFPNVLFNLSKLSVWWLRLGITIERIKPPHAVCKQTAAGQWAIPSRMAGTNACTGP